MIVQTSTDDLQLDTDAFIGISDDLEIAYDYWSPDGVPFISMLNLTEDTLYLDLQNSTFIQRSKTSDFEDFLSSDFGYNSSPSKDQNLTFKRIDRRPVLVLSPQTWSSFYGPRCHNMKSLRKGEDFTFNYVYLQDSIEHELGHRFTLSGLERIKRKELDQYQRLSAGPDLYYIDQEQPQVQNQAAWIALDVLVAVLFAL